MKIAFYIAEHGTWLDKLIAWWTRPNFFKFWESGRFSHTEILFSNGVSFSASPREGECRFKYINYDPEKWEFIDLTGKYSEPIVKARCLEIDGKPYDWFGIFFTFVMPLDRDKKSWWFCSEAVARKVFQWSNSNRYHPNKLYKALSNQVL